MARTKQPQQLAAVRIGYELYLVPAANAAKVVELLAQAVRCRDHYEKNGVEYTIEEPVTLEYRIVRPSQVRRGTRVDDDGAIILPVRITERAGVQGLLPAPEAPLYRRMKL